MNEHSSLLAELGRVTTAAPDFRDVFEVFAKRIKDVMNADQILISSVDLSAGTYTPVFLDGDQEDFLQIERARTLAGSAHEIALRANAPLLLTREMIDTIDWRFAPEGINPYPEYVSWMSSPLTIAAEPLGVLMFRSTTRNAYGPEDVELIGQICDQIAGAFANWQRLRVVEQEARVSKVLADLGRITNQALDVGEIYDELARSVARVVPLDRLVVSTFSESLAVNRHEYVFGVPIPEQPQDLVTQFPEDLVERVRSFRSPLIVDEDLTKRFPVLAQSQQTAEQHGLRSWLIAPLVWRDETIGTLTFRHKEPDHYTTEHLRIAGLVADQISGAIASSRTYQIERRESDIRKALANISLVVSRDLNVHGVYDRVADELNRLIPYDRLTITLFNPETEGLTLVYVHGIALPEDSLGDEITHPDRPRTWRSYFDRGGKSGATNRERELAELGLQSWIQATIGTQLGGPGGFLSIRSRNLNQYSDEDAELLRQVAAQITPAIQNARLFEQSIRLNEQRERAEALDEENLELQRVADARSEFLSTVSHELRTPLTSISAFSDILSRNRPGTLTNQQRDQIEVVKRSTSSLKGLIDDLLDVSRADTGRLNIERTPFDIQSLISEFTVDAVNIFDGKSQRLETINVPEPVWINADRGRITQVLNNLVSNASKYSPPDTQIYLRINVAEGKLEVEIEDQGIGISSHDIANVFTPFFRAPNKETRHESGTGLGLSVVKTIVNLHGGEIELDSEYGRGTKAQFWIPGITSAPDHN